MIEFFLWLLQDLCVPFRPIYQSIFFPDCTHLTKPFSSVFFFASGELICSLFLLRLDSLPGPIVKSAVMIGMKVQRFVLWSQSCKPIHVSIRLGPVWELALGLGELLIPLLIWLIPFSLSSLICSKIYLFSSLIFYANCLLKCGTLNPIMLLDFLLSIFYIFLTKERFYKMTGSMFSLQMTLAFLYLEICNA